MQRRAGRNDESNKADRAGYRHKSCKHVAKLQQSEDASNRQTHGSKGQRRIASQCRRGGAFERGVEGTSKL